MPHPSEIVRELRGRPIATLAELGAYANEVPEALSPPPLFTRFTGGEEVDPSALYLELDSEGRRAAGDSDAALEMIEVFKGRLREAFPDELPD